MCALGWAMAPSLTTLLSFGVPIPFVRSPRFNAWAASGFGVFAVVDAFALALSIARGQFGFAAVRHACFLVIFSAMAVVCARRWRNTSTAAAAADDFEPSGG